MFHDVHVSLAALRLANAGYRVEVNLTSDKLRAYVRNVEMVRLRIKNACVPDHKIWQAVQAADSLKAAGKL